jgi:IclR family acetate operon transcriptional repressor
MGMTEMAEDLDGQAGKSSSAIGKAFAVLEALRSASGPMTLSAVAAEAGIAASSAHSIMSQLLDYDAVVQDEEKRYRLGPTLLYLGAAFARGTRVYRSVWIELVTAANELSVTAALAVPWDDYHLILNSHRAPNSDVAVPYGGRIPLDAASWGKVYYAYSGAEIPKTLTRYTGASIVDRARFAEEVQATRTAGYAIDDEEFHEGVAGVCAAVTGQGSDYEGLVSFVAPKSRIGDLGFEALGRRLATLASRASLTLGDRNRLRFFGTE